MRSSIFACAALALSGCPAAHSPAAGDAAPGLDAGTPTADTAPPSADTAPPTADTARSDSPPMRFDAPPRVGCEDLAPAACLGAGCVPVFDDACCPTCTPRGFCADCTNLGYHRCEHASVSCGAPGACGPIPQWACGAAAPDCAGATVVDVDSCTRAGCVPSYPSGTGTPDPGTAVCAPIVAESCTVACRRIAPPCPDGTWPEGDGFCYTDRCIPSFVCDR